MRRHLFTIEIVIGEDLKVDEGALAYAVDGAVNSSAFWDVLQSHAVSHGVDPDVLWLDRAEATYEGPPA